jgi:hypothetical protein
MKDIGRCPRCDRFLIAEQVETHRCTIPINDVKEIYLDWMNDGVQNENEDVVHVAMGLDGILYRLILCKHNPPHNIKHNWIASDECLQGKRPDEDSPEPLARVLVPLRRVGRAVTFRRMIGSVNLHEWHGRVSRRVNLWGDQVSITDRLVEARSSLLCFSYARQVLRNQFVKAL